MNGSLETIDNRPALRFERHVNHSVERVWRAISEPAELARWFVAAPSSKPAAGARFEAAGLAGEVTEFDAPHVFAWSWGGELFRFELRPDGRGCVLVFTHVFSDRSFAAQHAAGWETYLNRLDAHLAGGFLSEEEAHTAFPELHERYAESFDSDPAPGRSRVTGG